MTWTSAIASHAFLWELSRKSDILDYNFEDNILLYMIYKYADRLSQRKAKVHVGPCHSFRISDADIYKIFIYFIV